MREDKALANRFLPAAGSIEVDPQEIEPYHDSRTDFHFGGSAAEVAECKRIP